MILTVIVAFWMGTSRVESQVYRHASAGDTLLAATGANITGGAAQTYTFSESVGGAYVQISPNSDDTLYIKWNDTGALTTSWDVILVAGGVEYAELAGGGIDGAGVRCTTVTIYSATDATLGTDFVVKGIELK